MFIFPQRLRDLPGRDMFSIRFLNFKYLCEYEDWDIKDVVTVFEFFNPLPDMEAMQMIRRMCFEPQDLVFICRTENQPVGELHRFKGFTWN